MSRVNRKLRSAPIDEDLAHEESAVENPAAEKPADEEWYFPEFCDVLRRSGLQSHGGQVFVSSSKAGDRYEEDGYIYNHGKRSRRWCIDPRANDSGKSVRMWPSRLADLAGMQRLALRIKKLAYRQQETISSLLHKYHAAGIRAVTFRWKGMPAKDGSLRYEICEADRLPYGHKGLGYCVTKMPPIVSLVDAVEAHAYPSEGEAFHRAVRRADSLWKRLYLVRRLLDVAIRHRIGKVTCEKVYTFEVCGVNHVYRSEERHPGFFSVKLVQSEAVIEKVTIE